MHYSYTFNHYIEADTPKVNLPYPITDYNDYSTKPNTRLDFNLPENIKTEIKYNPETGMYDIYQKIGDRYYRYPTSMTLEEYMAYMKKKAMNDYFQEKIKDEDQAAADLIPPLKVGGKGFDMIFGGDEISIRPQGSAELNFGVNISRYDNPILPVKQRRVTTFDFQSKIQINLVGQIGDKLKLEISQNTEATFNFQNQVKIGYTGYEDEIIQKIEAGNVTLPLNTSLIQGSQSLFGIRTDLKFGRLTVNTILSQQKGKRQEINVAGGAQIQDFEVKADNYEANKHYFLNFYHREHYDEAMKTMPYVNSGVNITKIEVWVTNRVNRVENTRNIIGFTDLGETKTEYLEGNTTINGSPEFPDNDANQLYQNLKNDQSIREFSNAVATLAGGAIAGGPYGQSVDYEKVENARQLSVQEFNYNALLGFISLRQPLNQDEVLAVSYQYTYRGETYQVGEFSTDVPIAEGSKSALILKLLKATVVNPQNRLWDLMMKNVYSLGAYQVGPDNFQLDIWYNNPKTSVDVNYLPYTGVDDKILIQYLDLDRLNLNTESFPDGRFDFVPFQYEGNRVLNGGTIDARTGRIYFTTVEPFGTTLSGKLTATGNLSPFEVDRISFQELYDSTKTAAQQLPAKNRFLIKGSYKSSVSSDIALNSLNIPDGSVSVTAGGVKLVEGVDYTVDYNLGRVKILNQGILEAQTPIKVQLESNSLFGFNSKSLVGAHFNYEFNKDFNWGATVMNLTEKPLTQKVNIGNEPISNTVLGTDFSFRSEVPFLTKMVDFLPVISTKEKSFITASGEFAYLIPGTQRAIGQGGISYIDGFEGSQSAINISNFGSWRLASVPQGQTNMFPETVNFGTGLQSGFGRAQLAWYVIDPTAFYQNYSNTPEHIKNNDSILQDSRMRMVQQQELFPQSQPVVGTLNNISVFDLAYYPKERGPYNYDTDANFIDNEGLFTNPQDRWAGIMRSLTTTNFETANVQYIQFWMLDPYNDDATKQQSEKMDGGYLYFNLGNVSEDVLPDSRKSFENGNPLSDTPSATSDYDTTAWALINNQQVVVAAFDNNGNTRQYQDIGLDGFNDQAEADYFSSFITWVNNSTLNPAAKAKLLSDPSSDNYNYYLDDDYDVAEYDILRRYKLYNGMEGNSPSAEMADTMNAKGYPVQATTVPDIEDLNQDNNLSETENYFQYKVIISPNELVVGQNFITNEQIITKEDGSTETWYQFKIPISKPDKIINNIADFRSIRFIRMFVNEFENEKVLRFAKLELIRGTWREYTQSLQTGEQIINDPNSTEFVISAVNLEENEGKTPVNYAIPPGIIRENDFNSINQRQLNEQSLALEVCNLRDGDSRATYKNITFDVRSYSKIEMFVHCEAKDDSTLLKDNELTLFVRLGTDFDNNYYEYELPMKLTPWGTNFNQDLAIWPEENNMVIELDSLTALKRKRDALLAGGNVTILEDYSQMINGNHKISIKGNPNLAGMKVIMIGVRNPNASTNTTWLPDDGLEKCAEIWVNELRLTDFKQNGGWASTAKVNAQLADFGNVSVAGNYSTPGWGSIEKKVSDRQREFQKGFDFTSNFQMGQFFGRKIGIQLPLYMGYSINAIDPQYDLLAPDVQLKEYEDPAIRKQKAANSRDLTIRKSYNFTNVRKERKSGKNVNFWDVENFSLTYSYNEIYRRDVNTEEDRTKTYRGNLNYSFSAKPKLVEPFKKMKFVKKSKWLRLVRDVNFYLGPKSFSFNNDLLRMYNIRQNRNALDTNFVFLPTYYKNFTWNRSYNLKYDFTKNFKFTFTANNQAIIREPQGRINSDDQPGTIGNSNAQNFSKIIRETFDPFTNNIDSIKFGGYTMNYGHNYNFSYKVPFNKFPLTDWVSTNVKLRSSYDWMRAPLSQVNYGNTIQNSRNFSVNGQFNFVTLYNHIGFLKKINNDRGNRSKKTASRTPRTDKKTDGKGDGKKEDEGDDKEKKKKKDEINPVVKTVGRMLMAVRNVTFNYKVTDGMLLPGFNGETSLVGLDSKFSAPSFGFISGQQNYDLFGRPSDVWGADSSYAPFAANNNWLVQNPDINVQHTVMHTQNISFKSNIQPIKYFSINLSINRSYTQNQNSYYRYIEDTLNPENSDWGYQNPINTGNLNFTTITWKTTFTTFDSTYVSETFQNMRDLRPYVSSLLGESEGAGLGADGYYDGYGSNQQDVLIGSFIAAYTGKGNGDKLTSVFNMIPLPNWDIRYDGLAKYKFMKKYVRNFTLKHAYRSSTSISNFQTNLAARDGDGVHLRDDSQNFISDNQIQSITITEQFAPFLGVDATWIIKKNGLITKFEFKKDRSLAMNMANFQITEMRGKEWVIGTGYKFSQIKMPFKFMGKTPKSDLNFRFDLSIRNSVSISRNIVENSAQAISGQKMYSIKSSIDYNLGKNLNVRLYFDRVVNTPVLSTAYKTANTRAGLALRFNLAQ